MKILKIFIVPILFLGFANPAKAFLPENTYGQIENIPPVLFSTLIKPGNHYLERYIVSVMEPLRDTAANRQVLTKEELERAINDLQNDQNKKAVENIFIYDVNSDGAVTKEEIGKSLILKKQKRFYESTVTPWIDVKEDLWRDLDRIMRHDKNQDGMIKAEEISFMPEHIGEDLKTLQEYTTLLKDNKLTAVMLEEMARKSFNTADENQNGVLELEEHKKLKQLKEERNKEERNKAKIEEERKKLFDEKAPTAK